MPATNTVLKEEGIGRLSRLGMTRVAECLLVVPKEYRDCTHAIDTINRKLFGIKSYFVLTVKSKHLYDKNDNETTTWKSVIRVKINAVDARGNSVQISVFGAVWPWLKINNGSYVYVYGELSTWNNFTQLNNPEIISEEDHGKIIPIYKGKVGQVSGELVAEGVIKATSQVDEAACLLLAQLGMRESEFTKLTGIKTANHLLYAIHYPKSVAQGLRAIEVAKKLSALAVVRRAESNQFRKAIAKSTITVNRKLVEQLISELPYSLTVDQVSAVNDIISDLRAPYPMNRLLSGDVGTGKTLAFMIPAVAAYKAGASIGIIVPSQLLVTQIAKEFRSFYPDVPVCEIISGGKMGEGIAIGTTALLSVAKKKKHKFDFIITDEQHKFSVGQKTALVDAHTNLLESTATAIPRTQAIVSFGGMDLSVLRECPVKKTIQSRIVYKEEKERMFQFVERVFQSSTQVAIILPLVASQAANITAGRLQSVESATEEWSARFPDRRVGILHGKMTSEEKNAVVAQMNAKDIDLLVSTVVIETGVTLPSLRAVVVVHPERFGASQLHQLRGRVARKGGKGYFFMFCPSDVETDATERLNLLVKYSGGFEIAEADMALRGFGDIECDSDSQTGAARLLFWGVRLERADIDKAAQGSTLSVAV